MTISLVIQICFVKWRTVPQEVIVSSSLTPNILMHVFSCLEIDGSFFHSNYGLKHHFTLTEEEYVLWEKHAKKCLTLGCSAELYEVLFQIPSYIPAEDLEMLLQNFDNIGAAIKEGSFETLMITYGSVFDDLLIYAPQSIFESHFQKLHENYEIILETFDFMKNALQIVWANFYQKYWFDDLLPRLEQHQQQLNQIIKPLNIVNAWKKILKLDFPYQEFVVYLVEPTTTIATNLLAEKIMIANEREDLENYKIIIHEVGRAFLLNTNIFNNEIVKPIALGNIERLSLIVDAACSYLKHNLFEQFRLKDNDPDPYATPQIKPYIKTFGEIWESLEEKNIYKALLDTYNKSFPIV